MIGIFFLPKFHPAGYVQPLINLTKPKLSIRREKSISSTLIFIFINKEGGGRSCVQYTGLRIEKEFDFTIFYFLQGCRVLEESSMLFQGNTYKN